MIWNRASLLRILAGDPSGLLNAFTWKDTPQGWDYWYDRYRGYALVSEDDRGYLIRLVNEDRGES